jgi:hypothetical protein
MIVVIHHRDSVIDQVSGWKSVCQSPVVCYNDFGFIPCAHLLGEVCVISGCRQSLSLSKWHNVSFKIVKIFLLFVNKGTKSANLVSSTPWKKLRGLSLRSLHLLWSVWHTFLPTITVLCVVVESYPAPHGAFF